MTVAELEVCLRILFDHARSVGLERVELGDLDLYWTISSADSLTIYQEPKPSIGSFVDDESELKKLLDDPSRASAVDLDRVAHLLKLLSHLLAS